MYPSAEFCALRKTPEAIASQRQLLIRSARWLSGSARWLSGSAHDLSGSAHDLNDSAHDLNDSDHDLNDSDHDLDALRGVLRFAQTPRLDTRQLPLPEGGKAARSCYAAPKCLHGRRSFARCAKLPNNKPRGISSQHRAAVLRPYACVIAALRRFPLPQSGIVLGRQSTALWR
jgi:hypothetical protein